MSNLHYPQFCALARAAEIIGERWTLLIIRELLLGPKRFGDLLDHLDGMSPTLLTTRLTALIECNVVRRTALPPLRNAHPCRKSGSASWSPMARNRQALPSRAAVSGRRFKEASPIARGRWKPR